jgi:hypothetical protein
MRSLLSRWFMGARQIGISAEEWGHYDWNGRNIKYHRAEIRGALGFREATIFDSETVMVWLDEYILPNEQDLDRAKAAALGRFRELHLELLLHRTGWTVSYVLLSQTMKNVSVRP